MLRRILESKVSTNGFDFNWVLVFVHSPSSDIKLMRSLVADVAVAVVPVPVVMESVAVEGPFRGRAKPEVIMDSAL